MPDITNFFSLHLDTTGPSLQNSDLAIGDSAHRISGATGNPLTITCAAADKYEYKIWGIIGDLKEEEVGDGVTTEFTPFSSNYPDELTDVQINGASQSSGWEYDSDLGKITFTIAPSNDAVITFKYRGLLNEAKASWTAWDTTSRDLWTNTTTKSVEVENTDGAHRIYVKVRDDVYNESSAVYVDAILDTTKPTVSITYLETQNDRIPTPKISEQDGKRTFTFRFRVNEPFAEYKVCVVADSSVGQASGTVIGETNGSQHMHETGTFAADVDIECVIRGEDLKIASSADGQKVIKIFAKDMTGNWSD